MKKLISLLTAAACILLLPLSAAAADLYTGTARMTAEQAADIFTALSEQREAEIPAEEGTTNAENTSEAPPPPTAEPVTVPPETTTAVPATEAPTTEPPTTEPPTTEPPATEPPSTAPAVPDSFSYGDVNLDGRVNTVDARIILRFTVQLVLLSGKQCRLADLNGDEAVTSADARRALRTAVRLESPRTYTAAEQDDDYRLYRVYNKRPAYEPYLAGFTTNIRDPLVFDKLRALEDYCASLGSTATFYYTDVGGQYYIQYNSGRVFRTQCTIKAPYVKSILQYMEQHNIPLSTQLTLQSRQKWANHPLSKYAAGTRFSIQTLITYTLRYSCNTAYQMLFDYFGNAVFNRSAENAGASLRLGSYIFGETSAADMAKLYLDLYRYNGKYRDFLFSEMEQNTSRNRIVPGIPDGIRVINKIGTGSNMTLGYHDCAIVFTETPFVLVIYTTFNFDRNYDKIPFRRIASYLVDINQTITYG